MDRVIPKDVVDLIYKELHFDKIKRLNDEYHSLYKLKLSEDGIYYVKNDKYKFCFNFRSLTNRYRNPICCLFRKIEVGNLPKRYAYSSGNNGYSDS